MKIYVWQRTNPVSDAFHSEGGLLVIADSLPAARMLAMEELASTLESPFAWMSDEPDHVWPTDPATPATVLVFPDAGCC